MAATGLNTGNFDLSFTSPAAASTVAQTAVTGMGPFTSGYLCCTLTGATGGVLDIYIQISPDGGASWFDYLHFAQLAAGAAAVTKVVAISKKIPTTTAITTAGTGTSPALAANTVIGGDWGDRMRILAVAGASTSAGAAQVIKFIASSQV